MGPANAAGRIVVAIDDEYGNAAAAGLWLVTSGTEAEAA